MLISVKNVKTTKIFSFNVNPLHNGKASIYLIHASCFLFMWALQSPRLTPFLGRRSAPCFGSAAALPQLTGSTCLLVEVHRERREGENHTADNTREVFFPLSAHSHANEFIETAHRGLVDGIEWFYGQAGHALDAALLINVED